MTTELFLGGLAILTLAAAIIIALTSSRRDGRQQSKDVYRELRVKSEASEKTRR